MLRKLFSTGVASSAVVLASTFFAQAQEPVKIGLMEDLSSIFVDIVGPGAVSAVEYAIEDFGGEVLGRPIELLVADHHLDPAQAAAIATEWLSEDNVSLITGVASSAGSIAVRQITREQGKLDIMSSGGTSILTNEQCSPTGFHWTWDSYMMVRSTAERVVEDGGKKWFFLSLDTPFGTASEAAATAFVKASGGEVVGSVKVRQASSDMSSFLLQAQASGADVIGMAIAGADFINGVRQASEFGVTPTQSLAALVTFISDVHDLGLQVAQGMYISLPFYWDTNEETRKWSKRFMEKHGVMPTSLQVGLYSGVYHYLKSVEAAGTTDAEAVAAKMRELPINDFWTENATIREDGRVLRPAHLYRVKSPEDSAGDWDLLEYVSTLPAEKAAQPIENTKCPYLVNAAD